MPPTLTSSNQTWPLSRGTITVGRQDTCDIVLPDRSLSRAHATLEISRDKIELMDNNSSNGTFVNNLRITAASLKDGDQLRFGNVECAFTWPESVIEVSASPISAEQAQQFKQKLASRTEVKTDWKASLASAAAFGAVGTGIVSGIIGAMMGQDAILTAIMVGAVGGIGTTLFVRNIAQKRVTSTLSQLKDDLDIYFSGQSDDIPLPSGFPELTDVVHSIRLGGEIVKDRTGNMWRMKLHEAQIAIEALRAVQSTSGNDRGFTDPLVALDGSFKIQGWNPAAKILIKPGAEAIAGAHLLEVMHNMELGSALIGVLNGLQPGQVTVLPGAMTGHDGRPLTIIATHAQGGPSSHEYLLLFVGPQA